MLSLTGCGHEASPPKSPKLIFVGLDGADWQLLDRFMADGTMPNLARLVHDGQRGILLTQHPPLSPLVWTTMMTGVSPLEHRILDFTRFDPVTHAKEPITSDERAVPAIWNMATQSGRRVDVFGLWATYPAEPINGTLVSDRLFSYQYDAPAPPGAVSPASQQSWAEAAVRNATDHAGFEALHRYVPSLTIEEYAALSANADPFASPITALRRVLIETETMHALATDAIRQQHPDLAIVYFQGTDAIGHLFAPYAPPQLAGISDADFARYHDVPRLYFARIDTIVGDYRRLAEETGAELVIASDHGFRWGDGRTTLSSTAVATAGKWHREEGIVVHFAPHAAQSAVALPAHVRDLCSYLLTLQGLPSDVATYRRKFQRAAPIVAHGAADAEAVAKLKALGYIGSAETNQAPAGHSSTRTAASYNNEGLILREHGRDAEAITAFESALHVDANNASALWNLSDLLHRTRGDRARANELLDRALALDPREPYWLLVRGRYALERQDCEKARYDFEQSSQLDPTNAIAFASLGAADLCLGDDAAADAAFRRSLALDPNQDALQKAVASGK